MERTIHVFDLDRNAPPVDQPGVVVLTGKQSWLRQLALRRLRQGQTGGAAAAGSAKSTADGAAEVDGEEDFSQISLDGETAQWPDLVDELTATSLFGSGGLKRVLLHSADAFVSQHRERLEVLFEKGFKRSVLFLAVEQWLATTRLAKWVAQHGWRIECDLPTRAAGNKKVEDRARIIAWVQQRAKQHYELRLSGEATELLLELTQMDLGRTEQELCKLSLYFQPGQPIPLERIQEIVGGWRAQTMFQVIDAAVEGRANESLKYLDQLFQSGEHPLAMLGALSWSIRRFAVALEIYDRGPKQPASNMLKQAAERAGFFAFRGEVEAAVPRIRRLGRPRIAEIFHRLMETEAALKGSHSADAPGRLALEKLIFWLAAPA